MTTFMRTKTHAPNKPKFKLFRLIFARFPEKFFQGHADSKFVQDLGLASEDTLKDISLTRVDINGKVNLFPHPYD